MTTSFLAQAQYNLSTSISSLKTSNPSILSKTELDPFHLHPLEIALSVSTLLDWSHQCYYGKSNETLRTAIFVLFNSWILDSAYHASNRREQVLTIVKPAILYVGSEYTPSPIAELVTCYKAYAFSKIAFDGINACRKHHQSNPTKATTYYMMKPILAMDSCILAGIKAVGTFKRWI